MVKIDSKCEKCQKHITLICQHDKLPLLQKKKIPISSWFSGFDSLSCAPLTDNTRLQCARSACSLGMWLTRPHSWRQSVFIYARSYVNVRSILVITHEGCWNISKIIKKICETVDINLLYSNVKKKNSFTCYRCHSKCIIFVLYDDSLTFFFNNSLCDKTKCRSLLIVPLHIYIVIIHNIF